MPRNHVLNVSTAAVGSSVVGTVSRTCSIGQYSSSSFSFSSSSSSACINELSRSHTSYVIMNYICIYIYTLYLKILVRRLFRWLAVVCDWVTAAGGYGHCVEKFATPLTKVGCNCYISSIWICTTQSVFSFQGKTIYI